MIAYSPPPHSALDILHLDSELIVINKPAGLLSVPGRGEDKQDCMLSRVQAEYPDALIVHRLDMATSGILLMARNKDMQREMSKLFEARKVNKKYIAVVDGLLASTTGDIELPLITDWPNRPRQKVDYDSGKPSLTHYKVIEQDSSRNQARLELYPLTGRSHQLRVHMQSIGHAILGDELYAEPLARDKAARLLLHASEMEFKHPGTHEHIHIVSESPF